MVIGLSGVQFVCNLFNHEYDYRWHEVLLPINHNRYNFRENNCVLFGAFNTKREIKIIGGDPV